MNAKDKLYQSIVDKKTEELLSKTVEELLGLNENGVLYEDIGKEKIGVAWWKIERTKEETHIGLYTCREVFLFISKKYLNGIKIRNGEKSYLNDEEVAEFD